MWLVGNFYSLFDFDIATIGLQKQWSTIETTIAKIQLTRSYSLYVIPLLLVGMAWHMIPLILFQHSNLCGPHYIELGYRQVEIWDNCTTCRGTDAIVHENISSKCELGRRGIMNCFWLCVIAIVSLLQAIWLYRKSKKLTLRMQQEQANATTSTITTSGGETELTNGSFTQAVVVDIENSPPVATAATNPPIAASMPLDKNPTIATKGSPEGKNLH